MKSCCFDEVGFCWLFFNITITAKGMATLAIQLQAVNTQIVSDIGMLPIY